MAYSVPNQWSHGDTVSVANMNKYSDSLNQIKTDQETRDHNPVIPQIQSPYNAYLTNRHRWLHYMTVTDETPVIVDLSELNNDVALDTSDSSMTVLDLQSVPWILRGTIYRVTGCQYVAEDTTP